MTESKQLCLSDLTKMPLKSVRMFGHPEVPGIDGLLLDFDHYQVSIFINEDDDTISWCEHGIFPRYPQQIEKHYDFWSQYLGKFPTFIWEMTNQQGFADALQFMFTPQSDKFLIVQMMAVASGLRIFSLSNEI